MHKTVARGVLAIAVIMAGLMAAPVGASASLAVLPTITFSAGEAIASPHGSTLTFQATLSAPAAATVSVHYTTSKGTALPGTDYTPTHGELRFAAGSTSGTVTVTLLPVTLGAGGSDKTFSLDLSQAVGAKLATRSVTGTIHPDVYLARSRFVFADVVVNPASTVAYLTVPAQNEVFVLNLATGTYSRPIPVGSDPHGIDITPDGTTLYVCDTGGQTISRVDIATRKVTTITTPPGTLSDTPYSIAIMNNGNALYSTTFSGSGFGANVYDLNLSTGASTPVSTVGLNGQVTESTPLSRSADYSTVGMVLGGDSGGFFDVYTAATGKVVSGGLNEFISSSSLNGDGSTMLIDGTSVIDAATGTLLGTITDSGGSSVLNSTGSAGYVLESQSVVALNVKRFLTGHAISLPEAASGQLARSPNGRVLVAETKGGSTIIEL